MAANSDVKVNITTWFDSRGLTQAERELRRSYAVQTRAANEMAKAEATRSAALDAANARQMVAMSQVGRAIGVASIAAAAGMALTVKAAMDWESAFAGVKKTVDGTDEEIASLESELRQLAKTLPATHVEIAAVAEAAGQLGVKQKDVAAFTRTMIALGESTNLSAEEASTGLARFGNVMGESTANAGRLGSALVELGNNSETTEAEILAMGQRLSGAGRIAELSSGQVLGMAAALTSVGINAEKGGSSMSTVILQMASDVQSGSDRLEEYARVAGVSADAFATAWEQDAGGALAMFVQGLGRMKDEGGNVTAALDSMDFSARGTRDTLLSAALAGDKFSSALEMGEGAYESNIALAEEFNKRLETTESQLAIARNNINDAAIDIGGNLLPALADGADMVANLAAGFGALPDPVKKFVTTLGLSVTGLGLLVGGVATAIPKLQALHQTILALQGGSSLMGRSLGGALSVLTGPWGIALAGAGAAVVGLTAVLGANSRASAEAKQEAQAFADTLDDVTGALTDASREFLVNRGLQRDWFVAAEAAGVSAGEFADALTGEAEALENVEGVINSTLEAYTALAAQGYGAVTEESKASLDAVLVLMKALEDAGHVIEDGTEQHRLQAEAMAGGADASGDLADATEDTTDALEVQEGAIQALIDAVDELTGANVSAERANIAWFEQLQETKEELASGTKTLDVMTEAGRNNRKTLLDMRDAGVKRAEAIAKQTGEEEKGIAVLKNVRDELIRNARQFFATDAEAEAYVDTLLTVPSGVSTDVTLTGVSVAETALARLTRPRTVSVGVVATGTNTAPSTWFGSQFSADGNIFKSFAGGGVENHVAQFASGGTMRVWAEPETGGEAYIPLSPAKRARSMDIWEETGRILGALGDTQGRGGTQVSIGNVYGADPRETAAAVVARLRDANALYGLGG